MPRVLVLSAPYGSGHDRVAAAVAHALVAEGATVETADHFERFVSPVFARATRALFWAILGHAPRLWGWAYALSARLPTRSPGMAGMNHLGARALGRYLAAHRPDAVVHVHPTSAGALSWLKSRGATDVPDAVVLTDFVAHGQWIYPHVDRYFAPVEEVGDGLVARGVPGDRLVVSGIPVLPAFAAPPDRAACRAALGLDGDAPVVLVTSGMRGLLGGVADACEVLARLTAPFRVVAVCGEHRPLAGALRARFHDDPRFRILGRVDEMHRAIGAADLVVTKAGAVTCAEALALERPLVLYRSLPGQEIRNEECLERAGAGVRARGRADLAAQLAVLLADPERRAGLAAAASRLRRSDAARTVAKEVLALAGTR